MKLLLYIARRLLFLIPILLGISILTFLMTHLIPGNPVYTILGPYASPSDIEAEIVARGLDQPLHIQYWIYFQDLLRGDLGFGYRTAQPVLNDLIRRFPATFELTTVSLMVALIIAVPLGVQSAIKRGTWFDHVVRAISVGGVAIPIFWSGFMLIYIFYFKLQIAPPPIGRIAIFVPPPDRITGLYLVDSLLTANWEALASSAQQLMLPVATLAFAMIAPTVRITRASMLEVLGSNYVRTAVASGLSRRTVIYRDTLKNALLPVVTSIGMQYGWSLGGEVLVEVAFSWPGMGQFAVSSIMANDYAPVQGFVLVTALVYVIANLVVDILYAVIDPRITY